MYHPNKKTIAAILEPFNGIKDVLYRQMNSIKQFINNIISKHYKRLVYMIKEKKGP